MADDAVVAEVDVRASADAVYAMFTDPALLVRWIGIRALLEPRPGGAFRFERDGVTHVRLTHRGLDAAMRPWHADGWRRYLARLAAAAEATPLEEAR